MSRPASATSSASTLSVLKPAPKPSNAAPRPSDIALFVTNLRLLDLDRRSDWPGITEQTFSTRDVQQNQKNRIRCVEWALYRLFELWDPVETRDKLQPFFPPLEPLQSLNLRAALYRCLNELKKNSVLGRETLLRKTMLDECKGDKLAEVLMVFSYAVVIKVSSSPKRKPKNEPIARRIATATKLSAEEQKSLLPLAVAHKAALTAVLQKKRQRRARYSELEQLLESKSGEILQRNERCTSFTRPAAQHVDSVNIKKQLRENWLGNPKWVNILLHGESTQSGDTLFESRFNDVCAGIKQEHALENPKEQRGLLQELESRVNIQHERLLRWRGFHAQVSRLNAQVTITRPDSKAARNVPDASFNFDAHQHLHIGSTVKSPSNGQARPPPRASDPAVKYETIVARMKEGLGLKELKLKPTVTFPHVASPSMTSPSMTSPSITSPSRNGEPFNDLFEPSKKFPALADVPYLPRSTSTPLGSETTLVQSEPISDDETSHVVAESPTRKSEPNGRQAHVVQQRPSSPQPDSPIFPQLTEQERLAEQMLSSVTQATPSPVKKRPRPSLSDRARMSMAHSTTISVPAVAPEEIGVPSPIIEATTPTPSDPIDPHANLLERTRQSMAHIPAHSRAHHVREKSKRESRQSLFPVNQFETPRKPNNDDGFGEIGERKRDITPKERLFEEDAEYASVFKSRPKIANPQGRIDYGSSRKAEKTCPTRRLKIRHLHTQIRAHIPYFFNAGLFHTASLLDSLTAAYAATLASSVVDFDVLFGPAYKGIPLAAATAIQLRTLDDARFGGIIGAPLKGKRVVVIDDVITAGTAIREAIEIIKKEGGTLVGIVVAFDRLEKTPAREGEQEEAPRGSAIGEVRREYGIPVLSILTLDDVVEFLRGMGTDEDVRRLEEYRAKYKASD
ncbi:hypothetical protein H2199_008240 [Coniosporium tulheliwenetii]|uniref:Uncharacterized protein n=1 Tax=Coniosporium tulheliwenetii TaxID=3383036 RepID=A0ACC2YL24_9PEZI|nr:hypothetical protein H2199_008240 [Cladosporium sp. JES 115]